jgi:hypothetical protein
MKSDAISCSMTDNTVRAAQVRQTHLDVSQTVLVRAVWLLADAILQQ